MKKFLAISFVFLSFAFGVFSQNSAGTANKNTALRCLKFAESCLAGKDWENAIKQADLGISYDDSISDLFYVKAGAEINAGKTRAEVLKIIQAAFDKNNWVGYSKAGARILLADLLSDTGKYAQSLNVLDSESFIYSADAEFIRIKNYYRMKTSDSIANARLKLNSVRRIYPDDERFPYIFFLFESMFVNKSYLEDVDYEIPEIVKDIASSYIIKLPDYSSKNYVVELLAASFAEKSERERLLRAIDAKKTSESPLLAYLGLQNGIYSEKQAFEMFFGSLGNSISLEMLESFVKAIKDDGVKQNIAEKLANFNGSIFIDTNDDLQNELAVEYELGRPSYIKYDKDNDGVTDLYSSFDFGVPLFVYFNAKNTEIFYDTYPKVSRVVFNNDNFTFNFFEDSLLLSPFELVKDEIFSKLNLEFYIPLIDESEKLPTPRELVLLSSSVELPTKERENAKVVYTTYEGKLVFANFIQGEHKYATCDFTTGVPFIRYVDYDNDGYYETSEIYDYAPSSMPADTMVTDIFTSAANSSNLYLRKVQIDRNGNTNYEFTEEYLEDGGKVTIWDSDDNGIWDCQYIKYPKKDGEDQIEETIYFDSNGLKKLSLTVIDKIPVKMIYDNQEVMIYAGESENIYWIEEKGSGELEIKVINNISDKLEQGTLSVIQVEGQRISVIKVDNCYYLRILPQSEVTEEVSK